jgi:hypothetical protein
MNKWAPCVDSTQDTAALFHDYWKRASCEPEKDIALFGCNCPNFAASTVSCHEMLFMSTICKVNRHCNEHLQFCLIRVFWRTHILKCNSINQKCLESNGKRHLGGPTEENAWQANRGRTQKEGEHANRSMKAMHNCACRDFESKPTSRAEPRPLRSTNELDLKTNPSKVIDRQLIKLILEILEIIVSVV